jgi:hypothetical protein
LLLTTITRINKKEQTEMNNEELRPIDITPTWEGLMPVMIALVKQGNKVAEDELMKLARSVDQRNAEMKETIDERNS